MFKTFATVLVLILSAPSLSSADSVSLSDILPDAEEREAIRQIGEVLQAQPEISASRKGATISFRNEEKRSTVRFSVDRETNRVTQVRSNRSGLHNEDFQLFTAFTQMHTMLMDHTFDNKKTEEVEFDGSGLSALAGLENLRTLRFPGGAFGDPGAVAVAKLPQITELIVFHTELSNEGLKALENHPSLRSITLGPGWRQELITSQGLESLAAMPALEEIHLAETQLFWEDGLEHLVTAKDRLKTINFKNCAVLPSDLVKLRRAMPDTTIEHIGAAEFIRQYDDGSLKFGSKLKRSIDPDFLAKIRAASQTPRTGQ